MRPVIGITASFSQAIHVHEYDEPRFEHQYLYHAYAKAVAMAGGLPLIIPVGLGPDVAVESLKRTDGLLLPGGVDISPKTYNQADAPNQSRADVKKDATELAVARAAMDRWMPIFGVCRGIQVLAVALGGNLIQDIETDIPWSVKHNYPEGDPKAFHEITLKPGSVLHGIIGADKAIVNTWHHQAVGEIPADWQITAETSDGVIEGMEYSIDPLIFGVQWHPEEMVDSEASQLALFKAFVGSCIEDQY